MSCSRVAVAGAMAWLSTFGQVAYGANGEIVGVVFQPDGAPVPGIVVVAGGQRVLTDEGGAFRVSVPAGLVLITVDGRSLAEVPTAADQTTEVLITLVDGHLRVAVEAPQHQSVGPTAEALGPPGAIQGLVTAADGGAPLAGVRVFVRGSAVQGLTDALGAFTVVLPSGSWDLSLVRAGYDTASVTVTVPADGVTSLTEAMDKAGLELEALTVRAPKITGGSAALLDERKVAATVSDVLGAEQMARSGDSDAASALRRVTGLTVVGGKYVYVRGLGDRYAATRLDGSSLPSPEPEKRVVPLDLFPSALLESVVIEKSFSPDRPAEFGGGIVEIRTRSIPKEPMLSVSLSGSYEAGTTGGAGLRGDGGPTDFLGLGTAHRALPGEIAGVEGPIKAQGIFSDGGFSADELERFGEAMPNRWALNPAVLPPALGLTVAAGGNAAVGEIELGALAGLVFTNGWDVEAGTQTLFSTGPAGVEARRITTFQDTQNTIRLGSALALSAAWDRGSLRSTGLVMRNSTASALVYDADDPTGSNDTHNTRLGWLEQQLLFEQLALTQDLGGMTVDVRYAGALATGREPDRRDATQMVTDDGLVLSQRGAWSEILYAAVDDTSHDTGLDGTIPVTVPAGEGRLKAGLSAAFRHRDATTRRFGYPFRGSQGIDLRAPIEAVLVPENIGPDGPGDLGYVEFEENTANSDDYTANQRLMAGYAMAELPVLVRLRGLFGARVEASRQAVETFELFDTTGTPVLATLATRDLLPAAMLTAGLGPNAATDRVLLRAGYGRTLSRPEFRELTEVAFYDYRSGRLLYGNPDLRRATIDNVDLRLEVYPAAGESVSLGVFFKRFVDPIERIVAVSAVSGSVGTFANAASARNLGAEVDVRKQLLGNLWLTANGSIIASEVDLGDTGGNQTSAKRPLQGQSPWVINAQLSYEDAERRTTVALLYNAAGPRIADVGTSGIPDTYELPVHQVDAVASFVLGGPFSLRVRGANLLDWPARQRTGTAISEEVRTGTALGLSLTMSP